MAAVFGVAGLLHALPGHRHKIPVDLHTPEFAKFAGFSRKRPGLGQRCQGEHVGCIVLRETLNPLVADIGQRPVGDHLDAGGSRNRGKPRRKDDVIGLKEDDAVVSTDQPVERLETFGAVLAGCSKRNDRRWISRCEAV
jgi:hypothetical protein